MSEIENLKRRIESLEELTKVDMKLMGETNGVRWEVCFTGPQTDRLSDGLATLLVSLEALPEQMARQREWAVKLKQENAAQIEKRRAAQQRRSDSARKGVEARRQRKVGSPGA